MGHTGSIGAFIGDICTLLLIYLVLVPLICFYTYKFYKHKSNPTMQHRDTTFVLSLNGLIAFGLITHRPMTILNSMHIIRYPVIMQRLFSVVTVWGTIYLLCVKSYLLFFQHQYHASVKNISWTKYIDSSWNDWYLRNKNKFGKFSYVLRWLLMPFTFIIVAELLGEPILGWHFMYIFRVTTILVPVLLVIILSFRLRAFYDIYGIRKEIISQLISLVIMAVIYFVIRYIVDNSCDANYSTETCEHISSIVGNCTIITIFSLIAISSVYYPLYLLRQQSTDSNIIEQVHFLSAIKDPIMLSLFLQHSVREFNTENVLFLIETLQVKDAYQSLKNDVIKISNSVSFAVSSEYEESAYLTIDFNVNYAETPPEENKVDTDDFGIFTKRFSAQTQRSHITSYLFADHVFKIQIPSELPTSNVLTVFADDIRSQIAALYKKYIQSGACLEVNLPHAVKQRVNTFVTANDDTVIEGDCFWILDECCVQVLILLMAIFTRFRQTETFKQYVQSTEYQTATKHVELIDFKHKPDFNVYDGRKCSQIRNKYLLNII